MISARSKKGVGFRKQHGNEDLDSDSAKFVKDFVHDCNKPIINNFLPYFDFLEIENDLQKIMKMIFNLVQSHILSTEIHKWTIILTT